MTEPNSTHRPASTPALELVDVTKRYGDTTALDLDGTTLTFRPGEFHGLVGPNGSGKTTLFRLLTGIARPTSGSLDRGETTIGYSFQEPRFYPSLTARENLAVFRGFADDPPPDSWIETLLEELRLEPAAHRRADELSGGFRKKLDLALALVKRPQFLLLDEPLADVDDHSRRRIRAFLEGYQSGSAAGDAEDSDDTPERTVVISTHNVDSFASALDRVTVLVDGTVRADGDPEADILEQYRDVLE